MTIKEVEERTGLTRSNIRFYEKEKLIEPLRNDKNGYRDYSERDIENIKKIAYLRTLEISVEDIRSIMSEKVSLIEILEKQNVMLQEQIESLNKAKILCERMLEAGNVRLVRHGIYGEIITEYLINYMCFIALSLEVFSILFTYGLVKRILTVLIVDTVVLIGILILGMTKMEFPGKRMG